MMTQCDIFSLWALDPRARSFLILSNALIYLVWNCSLIVISLDGNEFAYEMYIFISFNGSNCNAIERKNGEHFREVIMS